MHDNHRKLMIFDSGRAAGGRNGSKKLLAFRINGPNRAAAAASPLADMGLQAQDTPAQAICGSGSVTDDEGSYFLDIEPVPECADAMSNIPGSILTAPVEVAKQMSQQAGGLLRHYRVIAEDFFAGGWRRPGRLLLDPSLARLAGVWPGVPPRP